MRLISNFYFSIRRLLGSIVSVLFLSCAVVELISAFTRSSSSVKNADMSDFQAAFILTTLATWLFLSFYVRWTIVEGRTENVLQPVAAILSLICFVLFCVSAGVTSFKLTLDGIILYVWILVDVIEASRIISFLRTYFEYGYFAPYYD